MNGYVNFDADYFSKCVDLIFSTEQRINIDGIYNYVLSLVNLNKLVVISFEYKKEEITLSFNTTIPVYKTPTNLSFILNAGTSSYTFNVYNNDDISI